MTREMRPKHGGHGHLAEMSGMVLNSWIPRVGIDMVREAWLPELY